MLSWIFLILFGIWHIIKWSFKWIFAPFIIGYCLFWAVAIASMLPFIGAFLHGAAIIVSFSNILLPLLENPLTWKPIILLIVLLFAFIDCIYDLIFTATSKLYKSPMDDEILNIKWVICGFLPAVGSAAYYYTTPSDQSRISNIIAHYSVLLLLLVAPRALFLVLELFAAIKVYPKVSEEIASGNFFQISKTDAFYRYLKRYVNSKQRKGLVISNAKTIYEEKKISQTKLDKKFPKTSMEKLTESLIGDKSIIAERDNEKKEFDAFEMKVSYISKGSYDDFCQKMESVLRQCGSLSPRTFIIKKFPEKSEEWLSLGIDFFLIQSFSVAVSEGRILDEDKSDSSLVNHAYRHVQSETQVKVINANEDLRLALDDDD